jgi:hypothetical protein
MKKTTGVVLSVVLLVASISFAKDAPKANPFKEVLAPVPAAELPAKAADLVLQAKSRDRAATTVDVVGAAVGINPAAAPAIVGAVARSVPAMASVAAGAAAAQQPKQAAAIAKAAAAAAPSQARKIVLAVCRAVPNEYRNIAVAVSGAVPNSNKEILNAVTSARPDLKPYVEQSLVAYGGNASSVPSVLDQAARLAQSTPTAGSPPATVARTPGSSSTSVIQPATPATPTAATPTAATPPAVGGTPLVRGPAVGPPYIPLGTTPTNVTSGTSGEVPEGGRNYAAP